MWLRGSENMEAIIMLMRSMIERKGMEMRKGLGDRDKLEMPSREACRCNQSKYQFRQILHY